MKTSKKSLRYAKPALTMREGRQTILFMALGAISALGWLLFAYLVSQVAPDFLEASKKASFRAWWPHGVWLAFVLAGMGMYIWIWRSIAQAVNEVLKYRVFGWILRHAKPFSRLAPKGSRISAKAPTWWGYSDRTKSDSRWRTFTATASSFVSGIKCRLAATSLL